MELFDRAISLNTTNQSKITVNDQSETRINHLNFLSYKKDVLRIKLDYPHDWEYKEIKNFFVSVKAIQLFPIVEVDKAELSFNESKINFNELIDSPISFVIQRDDGIPFKNLPLESYKDFDIDRLTGNGWNVAGTYSTTIGNNIEAHQVNYKGKYSKGMDRLFVKPPDAFQIYFISYDTYLTDKYLPLIERIINSIEFTN